MYVCILYALVFYLHVEIKEATESVAERNDQNNDFHGYGLGSNADGGLCIINWGSVCTVRIACVCEGDLYVELLLALRYDPRHESCQVFQLCRRVHHLRLHLLQRFLETVQFLATSSFGDRLRFLLLFFDKVLDLKAAVALVARALA